MVRLTREIRNTKAKRQAAEAESERKLSEFLEAKTLSDCLKHSESLLKNRRKKLIRYSLENLKVEPNDLLRLITAGVSSPKVVLTQDSILDPSLLFLGDFPINPLFQADLDALFSKGAGLAASKGS